MLQVGLSVAWGGQCKAVLAARERGRAVGQWRAPCEEQARECWVEAVEAAKAEAEAAGLEAVVERMQEEMRKEAEHFPESQKPDLLKKYSPLTTHLPRLPCTISAHTQKAH
eukprot:483492-Rhodomonas_salina.1